jgi:hypothetical protein
MVQRHLSESFHPNYRGKRAIGKCLSLYYGTTTGSAKVKCTNGGGLGRVSWIFDGGWDRPLLWLVVMI